MAVDISRAVTTSAHILFAASSIYFIIVLQFLNGTMSLLDAYAATSPQYLPPTPAGKSILLRLKYTSFAPLDLMINRLTPFFWPLVTGALPELTLFGVYMGGQLVASEVLVVLEGERQGNQGRVVSYSTIWGLVWQNLPWGFIQPIYNAVHVITCTADSPTTVSVTGDAKGISTIPLAITIGYILPSVLMCLPSPDVVSHEAHQAFLFAWQLFPLWIGLTHLLLKAILPSSSYTSSRSQKTSISSLRKTYIFGLFLAASSHLITVSLALALIYAPSDVKSQLAFLIPSSFLPTTPSLIFTPFPPFTSPQAIVSEVSIGIMSLLQYDTIFAGFSSLLWASYLASRVSTKSREQSTVLGRFTRATVYTLLFGPCGAALAVMWKRDEDVFASAQEKADPKNE